MKTITLSATILVLTLILAGFIFGRKRMARTDMNAPISPAFDTTNLSNYQENYVQDPKTHNLIFRASYITNLPNYQENFVLTSNGNYVANTDPAMAWRHCVWKEMSNGWRVGIYAPTNRPGYVLVSAGSIVTNSGRGYLTPPYGKFAKFELLSPDGKVVPIKPNAGITNMIKSYGTYFSDQTNVPSWASPTNGSLVVDFPETALATDFPRYPIGFLAGDFYFLARNAPSVGISQCQLSDLYFITNEGDYTLTVQTVLYRDDAAVDGHPTRFQTNVVLYRVDLPEISAKIHLVPSK